MADAVQHHLRHCALAVLGLGPGFVIDCLGQAFERAAPIMLGLRTDIERLGGRARRNHRRVDLRQKLRQRAARILRQDQFVIRHPVHLGKIDISKIAAACGLHPPVMRHTGRTCQKQG
jgi:hypothetical protein